MNLNINRSKIIWIINHYASTPETGMGGRHYYLGQELTKLGYTVYVVASSYTHILRQPKIFSDNFLIEDISRNFKFIWIKVPKYVNAHSNQRIINEFIFSFKLLNLKNIIKDKPDIILHSTPSLLSYYGIQYLCKFYQIPYAIDVRDFWPKTLIELGGYSTIHPFIQLLQWTEDKAYTKAKYAFSNTYNGVAHMLTRGMDEKKFSWIPNGISLNEIMDKEPLSENILAKLPKNKFIIGYTGSIGLANAINYLIDAIPMVQHLNHIHFIIVGNGTEKNNLITKVKALGLAEKVTFIEPISKKQVYSMLDKFDVCYLGWQNNKLYDLGISANKLPEYLYAAKPIIHSFSGAGDFVQEAKAGLSVPAENSQEIAQAIDKMYELSSEHRKIMGDNGRNFVLDNFDYQKIAQKLANILFNN